MTYLYDGIYLIKNCFVKSLSILYKLISSYRLTSSFLFFTQSFFHTPTTILYSISLIERIDQLQNDGEIEQTTPTIGFNVEVLQYKNIKFQVWDLGGQTTIRPYWRCYYPNTDAIIFVVDSCDVDRLGIAKQELMAMLDEEELKDTILLVFANKQDQKGALNAQQVSEQLGLPGIKSRQWTIRETSALTDPVGLFNGFDWVVSCIKGGEA